VGIIRLSLIVCAVGGLLALAAPAQEPPKPGKEHAQLKSLEGTWDATLEGGGKGTMTYKMGLGGLWLLSEFDGEFAGMKFQGKGMDTYDPVSKKHRGVWADSMSSYPMVMEGTFDKDNKVLTMTGEATGPEGKPAKFKSVLELKDKDTMIFNLSLVDKDGKGQPMIKITYKRKK
jgi:hypothetical protein